MRLSKTSTQAILAVSFLCHASNGTPVQAKHIAEFLQVPLDSVLKILQALAREHVIISRLGRGGGYYLDRKSHEINLLEIIEAMEGPMKCDLSVTTKTADHQPILDKLQQHCQQATDMVCKKLESLTIHDLGIASTRYQGDEVAHRLHNYKIQNTSLLNAV